MKKSLAIKKAGGVTKLADILGIKRQAVSAWKKIPPLRLYQLQERRPEWFTSKDGA